VDSSIGGYGIRARSPEGSHRYRLRLPDGTTQERSPVTAVWTADVGTAGNLQVKMKLKDKSVRTVILKPGTYTVSNLDSRTPEGWNPDKRGIRNQLEDGDFRWYYHLFGEPLETWNAIRKVVGRPIYGDLPVPIFNLNRGPRVLSLESACQTAYISRP
jgi:hypothetical protein